MEHKSEPPGGFPTPEVLAGQELRRLRREAGLSQEEVARRMSALGHDWHQTTVGRTETAARPLRLNEAVALAGLFRVPVTQLLAPLPMRLDQVDQEIKLTEEGLARTREQAAELAAELGSVTASQRETEERHRKIAGALEWAETHLRTMRELRDILSRQGDQR